MEPDTLRKGRVGHLSEESSGTRLVDRWNSVSHEEVVVVWRLASVVTNQTHTIWPVRFPFPVST